MIFGHLTSVRIVSVVKDGYGSGSVENNWDTCASKDLERGQEKRASVPANDSHNVHRASTYIEAFQGKAFEATRSPKASLEPKLFTDLHIRRTSHRRNAAIPRCRARIRELLGGRSLFRPRSLMATDLAHRIIIVIPLNRAGHYPNALHCCNNYTMLAVE